MKNILYIGDLILELPDLMKIASTDKFKTIQCKLLKDLVGILSSNEMSLIVIDSLLFDQFQKEYLNSKSVSDVIPIMIVFKKKCSIAEFNLDEVKNPLDIIRLPLDKEEFMWRFQQSFNLTREIKATEDQSKDLVEMHKELKNEHLMFFKIMGEMPIGLLVYDESSSLVLMSKEAEQITGYAFEEIQFKSFEQVQELLRLTETFDDIVNPQNEGMCKDKLWNNNNSEIDIERKGVEIKGDDGKIICRVDVFRDTTIDFNAETLFETRMEELPQDFIESQNIIIKALASLAEARGSNSGNHLERIRNYCRLIAENLNEFQIFPEIGIDFIDDIYSSSPLYDIGKVGIPEYILLKPKKLTNEEWGIMKQHTTIGASALTNAIHQGAQSSFLKMAKDICNSHHEKFDGSGYPLNLKGAEIPLSARIVSLADGYDTLRSVRVYKAAYTHEESVKVLKEASGKLYDPKIVESFLRLEEKFISVSKEYADVSDPNLGVDDFNQI